MKKILACASYLLLFSCSTTYQQIISLGSPDTKLQDDGGFVYNEADFVINYNFWSKGGKVSFVFTNNSDEDVYVDLTRSFLVVNGLTFDYFQNRSWSSNSSNTVTSSSSYGSSYTTGGSRSYASASATSYGGYVYGSGSGSTSGGSRTSAYSIRNTVTSTVNSGVNVSEKPGVWVPAHSSRAFSEFSLFDAPYRKCGFARNPSKKEDASLSFNENDTPYSFVNMLMIIVGEKDQRILNKFYVESFKNMRRSDTYIVEDEKNCSGEKTGEELRIYKFAARNKFYVNYEIDQMSRVDETDRIRKSSSSGKNLSFGRLSY